MSPRAGLLLGAVALGLAAPLASPLAAARPDAADPGPSVLERYRLAGRVEVPVREASGAAVLPGASAEAAALLFVSDEGRFDPAARALVGALVRVDVAWAGERPSAGPARPVTLRTGAHWERFDPAWLGYDTSPADLESIASLAGTEDLFLLAGERNPEDQSDDGANRLYLVRHPAGGDDGADLVAYFKVPDLVDDLMNDRFEGLAVTAGADADTWHVWMFKERTGLPDRRVGYLHGVLRRRAGRWDLAPDGGPGWPPLRVRFLGDAPGEVLQQSDACRAPGGGLWVLDRWKRVLHAAEADAAGGTLRRTGSLDLFEALRDVPGETAAIEPSPPGLPERRGFGRHEVVAVDALGRLYLACDRGDTAPSVLTLLAPR